MFHEIPELRSMQADGSLPTVVAAGSAPGESVSLCSGSHGGSHVSVTPRLHHGPDGTIVWPPLGEGINPDDIMRFVRHRMQQLDEWPVSVKP